MSFLERAFADHIPCDYCAEPTSDPWRCIHGREHCVGCWEDMACSICQREALNEASGR